MKPSSQVVLKLLREAGPKGLTSLECWDRGGGSRLAARVADLHAEGYDITAELVTVPTRNAPARVSRYVLNEKPEQLSWSA